MTNSSVWQIFVCYRRDDTPSATGRLCHKLQEHFGADRVFHDIESIEAGADFAATITSKITGSSIVLVMIGRHWLDAAGPDGRSRLFDPGDYVCLEIAAALQRGVPVIPVLVEGAAMPPASALPAAIVGLAGRQAHEITEPRWQYDSDLLVRRLEVVIPPEPKSVAEDTSTLGRTLLQSIVGWPADVVQLLVHPRGHLAALQKQPNFVVRATVFFAISHLAAARLIVLEGLVASVPVFVLSGVPLGAFILLLMVIPLHLAARAVRAPSHAPSTMALLAYIQSIAMVLVATGSASLLIGMTASNTDLGSDMRRAFYVDLPLDARSARMRAVLDAAVVGRPFLAGFALANLIWLYTAGWLVVASCGFRDTWRISRLRAAAVLILASGMLFVAGAFIVFAATRQEHAPLGLRW